MPNYHYCAFYKTTTHYNAAGFYQHYTNMMGIQTEHIFVDGLLSSVNPIVTLEDYILLKDEIIKQMRLPGNRENLVIVSLTVLGD